MNMQSKIGLNSINFSNKKLVANRGTLRTAMATILSLLIHVGASANPVNPTIINGTAQIEVNGQQLNITNSPGTIIDWQSFSINPSELTRFIQQNGQSAVLNRVVGNLPSDILGELTSNGKVFLINPNGLVIGNGARIDTAGFLGSTLDISNEDFLAGRLNFKGEGGKIENRGFIRAGKGGEVVLISPQIENSGIIEAESGEILLAAGHEVTLTSLDDANIAFKVAAAGDKVLNLGQLLANNGAVRVFADQIEMAGTVSANRVSQAADGSIYLEADSSIEVSASLSTQGNSDHGADGGEINILGDQVTLSAANINASGQNGGIVLVGGDYQGLGAVKNANTTHVSADTVIAANANGVGDGGTVIVWSDTYTNSQGLISARGGQFGGNGGLVETSGKTKLDFGQAVDVSAPKGEPGTWLIDPEDITIGSGEAASISNALNGGSHVSVKTSDSGSGQGNITVAAAINKTEGPDASLSLDAHNQINVNAPITSSDGKLDVSLRAGVGIAVNAPVNTNGGSFSAQLTGITPVAEEEEEPAEESANEEASESTDHSEEETNNQPTDIEVATIAPQTVMPSTSAVVLVPTPASESSTDVPPDLLVSSSVDAHTQAASPDSHPVLVVEAPMTDSGVDVAVAIEPSQSLSVPLVSRPVLIATISTEEVSSGESSIQVASHGQSTESMTNESRGEITINSTVSTQGGEIQLDAGSTGDVVISGTLNSSSTKTKGGNVTIQGQRIALVDHAVVDASGEGGGEVLIGGGQQGKDSNIQNADLVYIGKDASVHADGGKNGDGGRVIVFSTGSTRVHGDLTARGGSVKGDGGFIETSGLEGLEVTAAPDTSAANGNNGEWLIDPYNLTIVNTVATNSPDIDTGGSPWEPLVGGAEIEVETLLLGLSTGDVTLTTSRATGSTDSNESGNITWDANMNTNGIGTGAGELTLMAHNDITINGNIYDSNSSVDDRLAGLTLTADLDGDGAGDILIEPKSTPGSNIDIDVKGDINMTGNDLVIRGRNVLDGGAVTINADGVINMGTPGDTLDSIQILGGTGGADSASVSISGGEVHMAATGDISLVGGGGQSGGYNHVYVTGNELTIDTAGDVKLIGGSDGDANSVLVTADYAAINANELVLQGGNGGIDSSSKLLANDLILDLDGDLQLLGGNASGGTATEADNNVVIGTKFGIATRHDYSVGGDLIMVAGNTKGSSVQIGGFSQDRLINGDGNSPILVNKLDDLNIDVTGDIQIQGGVGNGASASIISSKSMGISSTNITMLGGSGDDAFVAIDLIADNGSSVAEQTISTTNALTVQAGSGSGADASISIRAANRSDIPDTSIPLPSVTGYSGLQKITAGGDVKIDSIAGAGARIDSKFDQEISVDGDLSLLGTSTTNRAGLGSKGHQTVDVLGSLNLTHGKIFNTSGVITTNDMDWISGTITSTDGTLNSTGTAQVRGSGEKGLRGVIWNQQGNAVWSGGNLILNSSTINNSGQFDVAGDHKLIGSGTSAKFINSGTLRKSFGTGIASFQNVAVENSGDLLLEAGTLHLRPTPSTRLSGNYSVFGFSSFTQSGGKTDLNGGHIKSDAGFDFNAGSIVGSGDITGDVDLDAVVLAPGHSPGTININGNLVASNNTIFDFELGGVNSGDYDVLNVSGSANLGGTMKVSFINGYEPVVGGTNDSFDLINAGSMTGGFASINTGPSVANVTPNSSQSQSIFNVNYTTINTPPVITPPTVTPPVVITSPPSIPKTVSVPSPLLPSNSVEPDVGFEGIPPNVTDTVVVMLDQVPDWPERLKARKLQMCTALDARF